MKKYIITTLLILLSSPCLAQELFETPEDLEKMQEIFYEAPFSPIPEVKYVDGSTQKEVQGMPLFKKTRVKITNFFRERDYNKAQKLIEKEKQEQEKLEAQEKEEMDKVFNVNFKPDKKSNSEDVKKSEDESSDSLELEGGVREHVTADDILLDAENIDFDENTLDFTATGSPVLVFPPQGVTIKAEKMVYNKASNILKAFGSVEVIKDGNSMFGDYMQVNMNEENAFIDNLSTKESVVKIDAKKADMEDDKITLHNGKMVSEEDYVMNFHTRMIGGNMFNNLILDDDEKSSISNEIGDTTVNIKAKEIYVNAKKSNDVITLKKAKIDYGGFDLLNIPSFTVHTNKKREFFDANYPELGSRAQLGMFAGPGFVFDTPLQNGSTVKLLPIINNKSGIGFGGMLKYRSATNFTDMGYGSSADIFILKGRQYLDDKLYMQYGVNSYMDEWFMGPRMSKYNAELIYHDDAVIHSTIGKDLNLNFRHRFGFGYMQNPDFNRHDENLPTDNLGTTRTRYMAQVSQTLFNYRDLENKKLLNLSLVMQGSAALYGTGDTQFIGRVGPALHTQYKHWMQDLMFFQGAYQDGTPMQAYDIYRYGHSTLHIRESLRLCKYLTVAWSGTLNLSDDSPNGDVFQENSFIVAIGPDDLKFNIGYDWVRRQTYFGCIIAMNTKGSSLEYEKMVIKNPDKLSRDNTEIIEPKVFEQENEPTVPKKMIYAEVIDMEDPDKEQI